MASVSGATDDVSGVTLISPMMSATLAYLAWTAVVTLSGGPAAVLAPVGLFISAAVTGCTFAIARLLPWVRESQMRTRHTIEVGRKLAKGAAPGAGEDDSWRRNRFSSE